MNFIQKDNLTPRPSRILNISRWSIRIVWLGYAIFLFVMTHARIPQPVAQVTSNWDKPLHLGAYFVLGLLTAAVCLKVQPLRVSHFLIFPALMIFAAFDEILQGPFGRYPDVKDWVFDCLGIALGLAFSQGIIWLLNHPAVPVQLVMKRPALKHKATNTASEFAR